MLVVGPDHDIDAYFNVYRRLISDVVVSVGCEVEGALSGDAPTARPGAARGPRCGVHRRRHRRRRARRRRRPRLAKSRRSSGALADELARIDADTYLVEVKAAAIDVVAEHALAHGRRVVLAANDVVSAELDEALLGLVAVGAR